MGGGVGEVGGGWGGGGGRGGIGKGRWKNLDGEQEKAMEVLIKCIVSQICAEYA